MIQLVVNVNLLREIDERKLINAYARFMYNDEKDTTDDTQIKENLIQLLDWDENGDNGLGIYCSKFEKIKEKDWKFLINFIKENHHEIKSISFYPVKEKKLESKTKIISINKEKIKVLIKKNNDLSKNPEIKMKSNKEKIPNKNSIKNPNLLLFFMHTKKLVETQIFYL